MRQGGRGIMELSISSVAADDASSYSCSAVNDVGQSQRTAVLTVNCTFSHRLHLHTNDILKAFNR